MTWTLRNPDGTSTKKIPWLCSESRQKALMTMFWGNISTFLAETSVFHTSKDDHDLRGSRGSLERF